MVVLPRISCEPPLGQTTVIDAPVADFVVALDWEHSSLQQASTSSYEVAVWHNGGGCNEWHELLLDRVSSRTVFA